ncbi:MAG: hemolysin III family protein [Candidatus Cloacimonadales bacterium]
MDNIENFSKSEELSNAIIHGIGLALAIAGLVILIVFASQRGDAWFVTSFTIYGATLVILFAASTLFHSFPEGKLKNLFEIFDHSAIFLLIAGSYTPLMLISLRGPLGWTLFGIVWGIACLGIVLKAFYVKKFVILSTLLYLAMSWMIVFAFKPLIANLSNFSLIFLAMGGLFYTSGTIFYVWRKIKYHHAIWHIFVLAGSVCHFFTILWLLS